MRSFLVAIGLAAGLTFASYMAFTPASEAGWGPPFACGAGPKTGDINWNQSIPEPGKTGPVLTGILAEDDDADADEGEFTIEELESGKPLFLYYFVDGLVDAGDDSYKLSQGLEVKVFAKDKIIDEINANWRAKKIGLDLDADRKKDESARARIEFWSYTGVKMGSIDAGDRLSSRSLTTKLKTYAKKNQTLAKKEIKRLQALAKAKK